MTVASITNIALDILFVFGFKWGIAGAAVATVIAQGISAVWVLRILFDPKDDYKLLPKQLQFYWPSVKKILRIGIPSGLNSLMFSVANMILQASINSFHDTAIIAGKTAATDVGELVSQIQYAFGVTCMSFAGQCYGAKNYKRIDKMLMKAIPICCGVMAVFAALITAFPTFVIAIFNSDPAVAAAGKEVLLTIIWGYLLFAVAQMFYNVCRGMGASMGVTLINVLGIIVPRLIWIWVFFPMRHSISWLYICYPLSWFISAVLQGAYYIHLRRKMEKML